MVKSLKLEATIVLSRVAVPPTPSKRPAHSPGINFDLIVGDGYVDGGGVPKLSMPPPLPQT